MGIVGQKKRGLQRGDVKYLDFDGCRQIYPAIREEHLKTNVPGISGCRGCGVISGFGG
jgi:hypothetical protein